MRNSLFAFFFYRSILEYRELKCRLDCDLVINRRNGFTETDGSLDCNDLCLKPYRITGIDGSLELAVVDTGKYGDLTLEILFGEDSNSSGLGKSLNRDNTRNDRIIREVSPRPLP